MSERRGLSPPGQARRRGLSPPGQARRLAEPPSFRTLQVTGSRSPRFFQVGGTVRAVAGKYSPDKLNRRACDMNTAPLATSLTRLCREAEGRSDRQLLDAYAAANDQTAFT